ncbi:MAG: hypothetical protein V7K41_29905, partial [Nostoc sp.]|uniref:hypothetical protein n=1 Tax=Nostoc sp. TaxID=1180 RepID=UPI002FF895A5
MFKIASEWKLIVNEFRANEKASIPAIEPKINFTSNIIGIFATSSTSPSHWYSAGDLLQLYQVGFGVSGYAQTAFLKIILNCYQVHRFNKTICSASNGRSKYNSKPFWINPTTGEIFPAGSTLSVTQKKKLQFWD